MGEVLDGDIRDAEQRAGGQAEQQPFDTVPDAPVRGDREEAGADREHRCLDGDQPRERRVLRPSGAAAGQSDDGQPCGRDRDAEPLPSSEAKVEEPLREDSEEHEATGEHGLDDRQRRARERADVQGPREDRDQPPDREPLRAKERGRADERVPRPDRCDADRAAVLEQEGQVGGQGRREREHQPEDHANARATAGRLAAMAAASGGRGMASARAAAPRSSAARPPWRRCVAAVVRGSRERRPTRGRAARACG